MPKEETKVTNLKINYLTREQYDAEKVAGRLSETELYMTPSDSSSFTIGRDANGIYIDY